MKVTRSGTSFFDIKKNSTSAEFPNLFSRTIMDHGEIYFWEKGNFHVITKAAHAREILTSPAFTADRGSFFVSRMPNLNLSLIQGFFGVVKKMMVMSDDSDHERRRKVATLGLEDDVLERFKGKLEATVRELILEVKGKKEFDFAELARRLPSTVLADLFCIPPEDRARFLHWSNVMTGFFGGASQYRDEDGIEVNEAALSLKSYFTDLVAQRRLLSGDDYVSLTLKLQEELNLSDEELISQLIMMLVAGMATTTDQLSNIMFLLAQHPEIQDEVRKELSLVPKMMEEFKRFDPAVTFIFRVARAPITIGGQDIAAGDVIFISSHAVNRDLPPVEHPFELNIHRKAPHFAYGYGPHYCLGAKLARLEMDALFRAILRELPPLRLSETKASVRDHYSLSFSGFKTLPLEVV